MINQARVLRFVNIIFGFPADICLFKVKNGNTRKKYEIYSKLTLKTPERRLSGVFIVNFEPISTPFSSVSIIDFEQVNVSWFTS